MQVSKCTGGDLLGRAKDEAKQEGRGGENLQGSREEKLQGRGREDQGRGESSQLLLINRGTGPQVE